MNVDKNNKGTGIISIIFGIGFLGFFIYLPTYKPVNDIVDFILITVGLGLSIFLVVYGKTVVKKAGKKNETG